MELHNAKTVQTGHNTYHTRAFLHPIQMNLDGQIWQDIKPQLVRDSDGWHVEYAPYYAEFKDDGARLICPDKMERSKYIRLPSIPLISNLTKTLVQRASPLDGALLTNRINMPFASGIISIVFDPSRIRFQILFTKAPGFSKLTLPVDSTGFDIAKLLLATEGTTIPRPRLIDASGAERMLKWTLKDGELSVPLDFSGLAYPVTFSNASIQVAASADDCVVVWNGSAWVLNATSTYQPVGYYNVSNQQMGGGMRFLALNAPAGVTWLTATLTIVAALTLSDNTVNSKICGELNANAAAFSDLADYQARRGTDVGGANNNNRTSAEQAWDAIAGQTAGTGYVSPDFAAVLQEMTTTLGALTDIGIYWDDHANRSTAFAERFGSSQDHATYAAPQFDGTWSVAGTTVSPNTIGLNTASQTSILQYGFPIPTKNLTINSVASSLGMGIHPATIDLKINHYTPRLQLSIPIPQIDLRVGLSAPLIFQGFFYTPATITLKLNGQIPIIRFVTTVTPGTIALILNTLAPYLFGGNFTITISGRYGTKTTEIWVDGMTRDSRYASSPAEAWVNGLTKSGRYG